MTEKVLGFKEKDGKRVKRDFVTAYPIEWQIVEKKLVPVVTLEEYKELEKAYSKLADEAAEYAYKAGRAEGHLIYKKLKEAKQK